MAGTNAVLSAAERRELDKLLAKANAANVHTPAVRVGDPYTALVNLSLPRRGVVREGDVPQCDLVMAGDTVYLTPEEAARFNRHDPDRDGRRIEVVRKRGADDTPAGRVHPSLLSGPVNRPQLPQPGIPYDGPRPDPPGTSHIVEYNPVPESNPPVLGSENYLAGDAMDIAPGGSGAGPAAMIRAGADQDVMAAAKSAMGRKA